MATRLFVILALVLTISGCAAVGLTLFGVGAGVAAGTGTGYTLDGIAYRTFTASLDEMRHATLTSLKRMDIAIKSDDIVKSDDGGKRNEGRTEVTRGKSDPAPPAGREIVAEAGDRKVYVELERLTARTTRMRVTAKQGVFFRDRATAGEIIAQTERALDEVPSVSQKAK